MAKTYKCQYCEKRFIRKDLINHIENKHEEMIPEGFSASRLVYNQINKVSYGKCRVCGKETTWNEKAGRYNVLCSNPKCKEHMREEYKKNMLRVKGTYNILNDPEQQKKMLANRSISGKYKFTTDGGELTYTGSYEKKCLEFMDVVMQIPSTDILSPGPTLEYEYNGEKHFYITDFYYIPYNLIIEVKDGGDNPNNKKSVGMISSREKTIEKEHLITDKGEYNYIRLTNNNFAQLIEIFMVIKEKLLEGDISKTYKINESVLLETSDRSTLSKNFKSKTPDFAYKSMNIKDKRAFKYLKDGKVFDDYYSNDNILNISNEDEYFRYFVNGEGKKNDGTNNVARKGELLIDTTHDKLIGYFTVEGEFLSLVIPDKKYRGYGFGKMMTKDSIQKYGCKELWVAKDNKIAIKLYKDIGFEIIDDNRYEDWYHMKINDTIKESVILESNNEFKNETELLNWMKNNIKYEHNDSSWKLKSYEEVLQTKSGDCHDQSLFEYTVFNRQNIKCGRLFIIEYYGDKIHDAGATHTICYFIKNNKYYWFENAWDNKRGIHGPYSNLNELKKDIYVNWEFSGKNDKLYICNLSGVKPGMDLEEYVTTALDTFIPKKYYNKNIQESAINENNIEQIIFGKKQPLQKQITLYHGTDKSDLDIIIPNSYNAGQKNDISKMSSFWFNQKEYAESFATLTLIENYNYNIFVTLDNDMKVILDKEYKNDIIKYLKTVKGYVYEKTVDMSIVGYGHEGVFPEYTLDVPVKPDKRYIIMPNNLIKRIKFISKEYLSDIKTKYKAGKMNYGHNFIQMILDKNILYYPSCNERNNKIKQIAQLADMTNNVYFRITYNNIGIYEAFKQNIPWDVWINFKKSKECNWLPLPPKYEDGYYSYFTYEGYKKFMKLTYPEMIKYLDKYKIKVEKLNIDKNAIIYSDKYQVVVNSKLMEKSSINESSGYDKYSKDIHKIIDSLSEEESNHIGNGYWVDSNHVIYRKVEYIDNEPVGFIDIYRLPKFDKRIGLVVIAVSEKARGKGIGRKLVNEAIFTCKENKDVYKLRWKADSDNTASINMAKSLGFKLIDENKNEKIFMYDLKESSINETYINTHNTGNISFMTETYIDYISRKYKSDVTTINLRFVHSTNAIQAIKSKCKYRIYNNDYIVIDIGYNVYVVDDVVYNRVPQDVTYNSFLKFHLTKVILSRYMKDENERLINAIATYESGVYAESYKVFKSSQIKDAEIYAKYLNKYGSDAVIDNLYRRGHTQYPIFEACKDVNEARKFLQDVDKISQKYNANFFIVTDGASMTRNGRGESNPAVKNARDSQIDWENKNGGDPDEDWLKDKVKESTDIFNFIEE